TVSNQLAALALEFGFQVIGLKDDRKPLPVGHSRVRLDVPLRSLCEACRELGDQDHSVKWSVDAEGDANLVLTLLFDEGRLPTDRRLVLEPWFENAAAGLPDDHRYARLLLATALGRLEEGGANVSVKEAPTDAQ